jgi:hypothetical protein
MTNSLPTFLPTPPAAPAGETLLPTDAAALLGAAPDAEGGTTFASLLGTAAQSNPVRGTAVSTVSIALTPAVAGTANCLSTATVASPALTGSAATVAVAAPATGSAETAPVVPSETETTGATPACRTGDSRLSRAEQEEVAQLLGPWFQAISPAPAPLPQGGPLAPEANGAEVNAESPDLSMVGEDASTAFGARTGSRGFAENPEALQSNLGAEGRMTHPAMGDSSAPRGKRTPVSNEFPLTAERPTAPLVAMPAASPATAANGATPAVTLPLESAVAQTFGTLQFLADSARELGSPAASTRPATASAREVDESDAAPAATTQAPTALPTGFAAARATFAPHATRPPGERLARPANLAVESERGAAQGFAINRRGEKNFVSIREEALTRDGANAGIGVAHSHTAMPNTHSSFLERFAVSSMQVVGEAPSIGGASLVAVAEPGETLAENAARRAVAIVSAVADASAESALKAAPTVSLRFKVGHEDLAVRIELRGGEVRAEFRTDSPELQAAVVHEWRAVSAAPESLLRAHEPIVVSSQGNSSLGGQGSSSQQQGQGAHSPFRDPTEFLPRFARVAAQPTSTEPTPAPAPVLSPLSQRLSAVA